MPPYYGTSILTVMQNQSRFSPASHADPSDIRAEIDWREKIPRLHIHWERREYLSFQGEIAAKELESREYLITHSGFGMYSTYIMHNQRAHFWLYNRDRRGWSWSVQPNGRSGYDWGTSYFSPLQRILHLAESREQVIRDSFAACLTKAYDLKYLPDEVRVSLRVQRILKDLLKDAVGHASLHSEPYVIQRYEVGTPRVLAIQIDEHGVSPREQALLDGSDQSIHRAAR